MAFAKSSLVSAGITGIGVFPLGGSAAGISVTKLLANGLEDRSTNRNWRPGPRSTLAMLGF